jgi:hypothetical protein
VEGGVEWRVEKRGGEQCSAVSCCTLVLALHCIASHPLHIHFIRFDSIPFRAKNIMACDAFLAQAPPGTWHFWNAKFI